MIFLDRMSFSKRPVDRVYPTVMGWDTKVVRERVQEFINCGGFGIGSIDVRYDKSMDYMGQYQFPLPLIFGSSSNEIQIRPPPAVGASSSACHPSEVLIEPQSDQSEDSGFILKHVEAFTPPNPSLKFQMKFVLMVLTEALLGVVLQNQLQVH